MLRTLAVTGRAPVALVTALSLALSPALPVFAAQAPAPAASPSPAKNPAPAASPAPVKPSKPGTPTASPAPPPAPKASPPPVDGGWPRTYPAPDGGRITVYQPQVANWDDQRHMVAYAAVSVEAKGADKPALGSIKLEADTKVSTAERLVNFKDIKITESNFPSLEKEIGRASCRE